MAQIICIQSGDVHRFGCPYCGGRQTHSLFLVGATQKLHCRACRKDFVTLADGVRESSFGIQVGTEHVFPRAQRHPLRRTRKVLIAR